MKSQLNPIEARVIGALIEKEITTPDQYPLRDVAQVEAVLESLMAREEPFVAKLPREPGKRESRYAHLFGGDIPHAVSELTREGSARTASPADAGVEQLAARVDQLALELAELRERLAALVPGFDDTP